MAPVRLTCFACFHPSNHPFACCLDDMGNNDTALLIQMVMGKRDLRFLLLLLLRLLLHNLSIHLSLFVVLSLKKRDQQRKRSQVAHYHSIECTHKTDWISFHGSHGLRWTLSCDRPETRHKARNEDIQATALLLSSDHHVQNYKMIIIMIPFFFFFSSSSLTVRPPSHAYCGPITASKSKRQLSPTHQMLTLFIYPFPSTHYLLLFMLFPNILAISTRLYVSFMCMCACTTGPVPRGQVGIQRQAVQGHASYAETTLRVPCTGGQESHGWTRNWWRCSHWGMLACTLQQNYLMTLAHYVNHTCISLHSSSSSELWVAPVLTNPTNHEHHDHVYYFAKTVDFHNKRKS